LQLAEFLLNFGARFQQLVDAALIGGHALGAA
jgi:hypothetical protein